MKPEEELPRGMVKVRDLDPERSRKSEPSEPGKQTLTPPAPSLSPVDLWGLELAPYAPGKGIELRKLITKLGDERLKALNRLGLYRFIEIAQNELAKATALLEHGVTEANLEHLGTLEQARVEELRGLDGLKQLFSEEQHDAEPTDVPAIKALSPERAVRLTEAKAKQVLRGPFRSNWFIARGALARNEWPDEAKAGEGNRTAMKLLMENLLTLRGREVEDVLQHVRDSPELMPPGDREKYALFHPDGEKLTWGSAGSQTLTSDIDINLKGIYNTQAVALFNRKFKELKGWPHEAGIVYDVNVYAQDFMSGAPPFKLKENEDKTKLEMHPNREVVLGGEEQEKDQKSQETYSLVKMRRYMTNDEWAKYRAGVEGVPGMKEKLAQAELEFELYDEQMKEKVKQLEEELEQSSQTIEQGKKRKERDHYDEEALQMAAANRLYEELLVEVVMIRQEIARLKQEKNPDREQIDHQGRLLRKLLSRSLQFANEAYFTEGAVHKVVIGVQIAGGVDLAKRKEEGKTSPSVTSVGVVLNEQQLLHAFNEQVGDTLKELTHASHTHPTPGTTEETGQGLSVEQLQLGEGLFKGGKYVDRMALTCAELPGHDQVPMYGKLKELGALATRVKKTGSEFGDLNAVTMARALSRDYGYNDFATVRAVLLQFGIDLQLAYREAVKRRELGEAPPDPKVTAPSSSDQRRQDREKTDGERT